MPSKSSPDKIKINFGKNLLSALISGLTVGMGIGLLLGFKIARINPSITDFALTWKLASHLMVLYALAGMAIMAVLSLILYPFIARKDGIRIKSAYNLYLPAAVLIGFFFYVRSYIMSHFLANPLLPLKGADWIGLSFTLFLIALAIFSLWLTVKIFARFPLKTLLTLGGTAALAFWIAAGIFKGGESRGFSGPNPEFEQYEPVETGAKVALIGIDGAWWKVMDDLMAQGKLPNFRKLIDNGVRGEMKTLHPTFSAMIWTSIATGKLPQKHGINSFLVWKFPLTGAKIPMFRLPLMASELLWVQDHIATVSPIPSNYRTSEALWTILTGQDKSVGVMSWWASWPAEKVNGYMFTDHALFNKMEVLTNYKDKSGGSVHDVYPPDLIPELQQLNYTPKDITDEDLDKFLVIESEEFRREFKELDTYEYIDVAYEASMFKFTFPGDKTLVAAAEYLLDEMEQPDLWAIYLQGLDSMSHQYLKYHFAQANSEKLLPINVKRYGKLIENYYIYMDEVVGEFLTRLEPETNVFLVSDHGFDDEMLPTGHYHHIKPDSGDTNQDFHIHNAHPGVFIASGPGIKRGAVLEEVTVLDVAPTILNLLGFPYAEDMDGRVLTEILNNPTQIASIPTFDRGYSQDRELIETAVDKGVRDKLKALGYVK